jgi:D-alanyl-D-alanine endopeptidase (penicillin-binding protein 7)
MLVLALGVAAPSTARAKTHSPVQGRGAARKAGKKRPVRRAARERYIPVYTRGGLPNIQARSALVVDIGEDGSAGAPLFQKNPDEVRPIASISKLLAMLVVLDHKLDLTGKTTITESDAKLAARGAKSRLLTGMTLSNRDLLHAALMASDNRAVLALGRAVGLSPAQHAAQMTARARAMGLAKTQFLEPTGLDYRNVSTAREAIRFLQVALKNPLIAQVCRTTQFVAHAEVGGHSEAAKRRPPRTVAIEYASTDLLLRGSKHLIHGGKTGYNDRAGYCFVVAARLQQAGKKPREVAMAFLGAEGKLTRFADFGRAAQWLVERKATADLPAEAASASKTASRLETAGAPKTL